MSDSLAHFMLLAVALVLVAFAARLPAAAAEDTILGHKCGMPASGNNASTDAYRSNLNALADILVAGGRANGSAVGAVGAPAAADAAYGVALCRGDFTGDACARGLSDALASAVNDSENAFGCGRQVRDVTLFYDRYQLRLSGADFLSGDDDTPKWAGNNTNFVRPADAAQQFDGLVSELVNKIAAIAAERPDRYATGRSRFNDQDLTLYGLVQCTVDMSTERCRACLDGLISAFPSTFPSGQHGGRILVPRCTVRYETDDTFFNTANLSVDLHKPKRELRIFVLRRSNISCFTSSRSKLSHQFATCTSARNTTIHLVLVLLILETTQMPCSRQDPKPSVTFDQLQQLLGGGSATIEEAGVPLLP